MTPPNLPDILKLHRLAQALRANARAANTHGGRTLPLLVLVTDEVRLADPMPAAHALPARSAILLRHYNSPDRPALAKKLADLCRRRGMILWIGADLGLAKKVGAHGLHLPEHLLWHPRPPVPASMIVTTSAHSPITLRRSHTIGADAALLSPVFATDSHPGQTPLGPIRFREWARAAGIPVYALGGITCDNAGQLMGSGAAGIAGINALYRERP
jgi:thiamine-phosphate pyrophosphorylase